MVSEHETKMEMVLPIVVTDIMQRVEAAGEHPEADFTERLRSALLEVVAEHPSIEDDIWDASKKEIILDKVCDRIKL
jgi:hypothetical protein